MSVLVTGGSGFVGVNLVKGLAERGRKVVSLNRSSVPEEVGSYLAPYMDRVVFAQCDVTDLVGLQEVVHKHGVVEIVHTATLTATSLDVERDCAWQIINVNVMGATNLFEVSRRANVRRVVYTSSGAVYRHGDGIYPHHEDEQPHPDGLYAISKYASEMIAQRFRHLLGVSIAVARLAQPYGPMERKSRSRAVLSPICEWVEQALRGEPIVVQALDSIMDWCYVDDMVDGILSILLAEDEPRHSIYNVGAGKTTSVEAVLRAIDRCIAGVKYSESPAVVPNPNIDRQTLTGHLDITRAQDEFGYQPRVDIGAGLERYVDWLRETGL